MATWDKYLTERDKQHVAIWGKPQPDEFGHSPALIVIDVYYSSVGHERKPLLESIQDWPMSCGEDGWRAIDHMRTLIASARKNSIPVIHIKGLPGFPSDPSRVAERGKRQSQVADRLPPHIRALGNEIVREVAPAEGELVIGKTAPSAFAGTALLQYLQMIRADTVIVCGESTSGCVRASVVDAQTNRFRVGIVEECCYDRTEASHWINLFDMHQKYGEVIGLAAATAYFETIARGGAR